MAQWMSGRRKLSLALVSFSIVLQFLWLGSQNNHLGVFADNEVLANNNRRQEKEAGELEGTIHLVGRELSNSIVARTEAGRRGHKLKQATDAKSKRDFRKKQEQEQQQPIQPTTIEREGYLAGEFQNALSNEGERERVVDPLRSRVEAGKRGYQLKLASQAKAKRKSIKLRVEGEVLGTTDGTTTAAMAAVQGGYGEWGGGRERESMADPVRARAAARQRGNEFRKMLDAKRERQRQSKQQQQQQVREEGGEMAKEKNAERDSVFQMIRKQLTGSRKRVVKQAMQLNPGSRATDLQPPPLTSSSSLSASAHVSSSSSSSSSSADAVLTSQEDKSATLSASASASPSVEAGEKRRVLLAGEGELQQQHSETAHSIAEEGRESETSTQEQQPKHRKRTTKKTTEKSLQGLREKSQTRKLNALSERQKRVKKKKHPLLAEKHFTDEELNEWTLKHRGHDRDSLSRLKHGQKRLRRTGKDSGFGGEYGEFGLGKKKRRKRKRGPTVLGIPIPGFGQENEGEEEGVEGEGGREHPMALDEDGATSNKFAEFKESMDEHERRTQRKRRLSREKRPENTDFVHSASSSSANTVAVAGISRENGQIVSEIRPGNDVSLGRHQEKRRRMQVLRKEGVKEGVKKGVNGGVRVRSERRLQYGEGGGGEREEAVDAKRKRRQKRGKKGGKKRKGGKNRPRDSDTNPIADSELNNESSDVLKSKKSGKRGAKKDRVSGEGREERGAGMQMHPQRVALEKWAASLVPEHDYNYTQWRIDFHSSSTVVFFNGYAKRLSKLFAAANAKVNFAMIGACDGTGDNTIKHLYLPNDHWRGVFVEPMSINLRDLVKYMTAHGAGQRSVIIHAAATSHCASPTLMVERPLYEEKNASLPHWLRRQIGSVLPKHRDHARKEWTLEEVRCVTADDILSEWVTGTPGSAENLNPAELQQGDPGDGLTAKKRRRRRRPHVLKIDVEGHDYEVLMGFLHEKIPDSELPLLIDFEAKSIAKMYPAAKEAMEKRGYVVSPFGQDGFALLRAEIIHQSLAAQQQ